MAMWREPIATFVIAVVVALSEFLVGCGEEASLSLEDYVEEMQRSADELQALGEQVGTELMGSFDVETGAIVDTDAVGTVVADIASDLQGYYDDAKALNPPPEVAEAHNTFVEAAGARLAQWQGLAERATEFESIEDLGAAAGKSPAFQRACVALERAVADNGVQLDMDCGDG